MVEQVGSEIRPSEPVRTAVTIQINGYASCSGTILSNFLVLTAKQCFQNVTETDIKVFAGIVNLHSDEGVVVGVKRIVRHDDRDLTLLELNESLKIGSNEAISAVVLPPPLSRHAGKPITVVGWDAFDPFDRLSVDATVKTTLDCLKNHPEGNFDADHMFCANADSGTTASFQAGTGAVYRGWGPHVLVGVSSFGNQPRKSRNTYQQSTTFSKTDLLWIFRETKIR